MAKHEQVKTVRESMIEILQEHGGEMDFGALELALIRAHVLGFNVEAKDVITDYASIGYAEIIGTYPGPRKVRLLDPWR